MKASKALCLVLSTVMVLTLMPMTVLAATSDVEGTIIPTTLVTGSEKATAYNITYDENDVVSGTDPYKTFLGVQYAMTAAQSGILALDVTLLTGGDFTYVDMVSSTSTSYTSTYRFLSGAGDSLLVCFQVEANTTYYLRFFSIVYADPSFDASLTCSAYLFPNTDRTLTLNTFAAGGYKAGGTYYRMNLSQSGKVTVEASAGDNVAVTLCDSSKTALGASATLSDSRGLTKAFPSLSAGTYYIKVLPDVSNTAGPNRKYIYHIRYSQETSVAVTKITLNKSALTLSVGASQTLVAAAAPTNATNKAVTWRSSNASVASVSSSGRVTAKKAGTATITATAKDGSGKSATCKITVTKPVAVTKIKLSKTKTTLLKGRTATVKATILPANATNKKITWKSSKTSVATVDANGKITAKGKGTCTITATARDGSGTRATCQVTVNQPVTKITLSKTVVSLRKGKTKVLTATVAPSSAKNKAVTWSSSNKKVATVTANGKIVAKGKGKCIITCTARDGSKVKATCKVTVK